ncbi:hypothetical protein ACLMJK_008632 [Lecanora helva]
MCNYTTTHYSCGCYKRGPQLRSYCGAVARWASRVPSSYDVEILARVCPFNRYREVEMDWACDSHFREAVAREEFREERRVRDLVRGVRRGSGEWRWVGGLVKRLA